MYPTGDARTLAQPMAVQQGFPVQQGYPVQAGYPAAPGVVPVVAPGMMMAPGMAPPMAMAPGQVGMTMTGMQHIATMPALQVKEKANMLQEITALLGAEVQMANKYNILDGAGNQIFYAVENTDCCRRQLQTGCCHDCAPYDVDILYTPPGQLNQHFVRMTRPCQFTCCCLNRPVAEVLDRSSGGEVKIGSFRDPCTCCCLRFQVRDHNDNDVLEVDGGCCCTQPGMLCPLPCGPCSRVQFDIKDSQSGAVVAKVEKQVPSCLTFLFAPDVDNYQLEFNQVENPQWKAILLAFTIFMDFRYFNTNRNEQNAQQMWSD